MICGAGWRCVAAACPEAGHGSAEGNRTGKRLLGTDRQTSRLAAQSPACHYRKLAPGLSLPPARSKKCPMGRGPCRVTSSTRLARRSCRPPAKWVWRSGSMRTCRCSARRCRLVPGPSAIGWRSSRWKGATANLDGTPGELTIRRYRRFGAGGAKLIWGEACAVVPEGRANPRQLLIDESTASSLERTVIGLPSGSPSGLRSGSRSPGRPATDALGTLLVRRPILAQHDPLLDSRTVIDKASGTTVTPELPP